jgi:hypothetical protein
MQMVADEDIVRWHIVLYYLKQAAGAKPEIGYVRLARFIADKKMVRVSASRKVTSP